MPPLRTECFRLLRTLLNNKGELLKIVSFYRITDHSSRLVSYPSSHHTPSFFPVAIFSVTLPPLPNFLLHSSTHIGLYFQKRLCSPLWFLVPKYETAFTNWRAPKVKAKRSKEQTAWKLALWVLGGSKVGQSCRCKQQKLENQEKHRSKRRSVCTPQFAKRSGANGRSVHFKETRKFPRLFKMYENNVS